MFWWHIKIVIALNRNSAKRKCNLPLYEQQKAERLFYCCYSIVILFYYSNMAPRGSRGASTFLSRFMTWFRRGNSHIYMHIYYYIYIQYTYYVYTFPNYTIYMYIHCLIIIYMHSRGMQIPDDCI